MREKLYLFDIDGTILSPGPAARKAITRAIANYSGVTPNLQIENLAGFTDRLIVKNALNKCGVDGDLAEVIERIIDDYLRVFSSTYLESDEPFVYEDAINFVNKVIEKRQPIGLLTGNVERGAQIKLGRFDLMKYFPFGAYGNDRETRYDLPLVAKERAEKYYRKPFDFNDIVLVGDTAEDATEAAKRTQLSRSRKRPPRSRLQYSHP